MNSKDNLVKIDGVLWLYEGDFSMPYYAYCPQDRLQLYCSGDFDYSTNLSCENCQKNFILPRPYTQESVFVENMMKAKSLQQIKVIDFDNEAIPLAESTDGDETHFVTAKLVNTKVGKRLVVYAGEKGASDKTQIFIEPDIKRLAFDQKDQHPSEVFVKLEAQFEDGTKHSIEKRDDKNRN